MLISKARKQSYAPLIWLILAGILSPCSSAYSQSEAGGITDPAVDLKQFPELDSPDLVAEASTCTIPKGSDEMQAKWLMGIKRMILADRFRRAGEKLPGSQTSYDLFRKSRLLEPGVGDYWLYEAKALKSLGRLDECLSLLNKAPDNTFSEHDFLALRVEILIQQKKYEDALKVCDNLQVGSRDGKPYKGRGACVGIDYKNHALRSKIFALTNRPAEAARELKLASYLCTIAGVKAPELEEQTRSLSREAPKQLQPITTDNQKALEMMDLLMQLKVAPSKNEAEIIFKRPMLQETGQWISADQRETFSSVRGEQFGTTGVLNIQLNAERVYLTRADLEKHFGAGVYQAATHAGCISTGAAETFRFRNGLIVFPMPAPVFMFTVSWVSSSEK